MSGQAHEYRSLVLRFAPDDATMQDRIDEELRDLGSAGWDLVGFTTQLVPDGAAATMLYTFAFRRVRMAGPRAGR